MEYNHIERLDKIENLDVEVKCPPSKAHTLRSLIVASLANGVSKIKNPLLAEDQLNVINALRELGIKIEQKQGEIIVFGKGCKYSPLGEKLDIRESGVGMNFLSATTCLANKDIVLTGTERIKERPISGVVEGMRQLGCEIEYLEKKGYPPIKIKSSVIPGGNAKICGNKTSQYFSAISIASVCAEKDVVLDCIGNMREKPYIDITLEVMKSFGGKVEHNNYKQIKISSKEKYKGTEVTIEGDYSSASFFFLIAAICSSKVRVKGLNPNSVQGDKVFLNILKKMGCDLKFKENSVSVKGNNLNSIEYNMEDIPDLVPPTAIACAFAKGTSFLRGVGHLVHKESNRIHAIISELGKMGVSARFEKDTLIIQGSNKIKGSRINSHNDHRIAMSFAVAGLAVGEQEIENPKCVAKSFPDFWKKIEIFRK